MNNSAVAAKISELHINNKQKCISHIDYYQEISDKKRRLMLLNLCAMKHAKEVYFRVGTTLTYTPMLYFVISFSPSWVVIRSSI